VTVCLAAYEAVKPPLEQHFGVLLPEIPAWVFAFLGGLGIYGRSVATKGIK
jgi:hypothetical protein